MPQDESHARIGPTGHYTAYVWSRLGLPHADLFTTARGRRLFWTFRLLGEGLTALSSRVPSMEQHLGYRHLLLDSQLRRLAPDRVVELAAGLSPRGVEWAADRGVSYLELDLPAMVAVKQARLERAPEALRDRLAGRHSVRVQDVLAPQLTAVLEQHLAGGVRPVVLNEGLLVYFDVPQREQLFRAIAQALRRVGGGVYLCDLYTAQDQAGLARAAQALRLAVRLATRGADHHPHFRDHAAIRQALTGAGFDTAERLSAADHVAEVPALEGRYSPVSVYCARVGES